MYKYETHLHTAPVSRCAKASVMESLAFYKRMGYDGVFITNHFINGNINIDKSLPFAEKIDFYFSDYEEALRLSKTVGIKVFLGVEMTYGGSDFLVYGLDKAWYLAHPEIEELRYSELLKLCMAHGAFVVHAHPFRDSSYIDHIRLFPKCCEAVEIYNASRPDFENEMAVLYAKHYEKIPLAGTDNHTAGNRTLFGGVEFESPLTDEQDFIAKVRGGMAHIFKTEISIGDE